MFRFPFLGYPYNYNYYNYYNRYINNTQNENHNNNKQQENSITNHDKISNTINLNSTTQNSDQAIFEIFGLRLFLDDLIIVGLLFFLYQQDVKDELLYIILMLLLFS